MTEAPASAAVLFQEVGSSRNQGPIVVPLNIRCLNITYYHKGPLFDNHTPKSKETVNLKPP